MAAPKTGLFSTSDLQFLLTLIAGMAAFWLSGHLPAMMHLPTVHNQLLSYLIYLIPAILIYGLGMFIWSWMVLRLGGRLKPALVAAGLATILALASSLALTWMGTHIVIPLALLAFILYLVYGIYFVIGWAVARRLAR